MLEVVRLLYKDYGLWMFRVSLWMFDCVKGKNTIKLLLIKERNKKK